MHVGLKTSRSAPVSGQRSSGQIFPEGRLEPGGRDEVGGGGGVWRTEEREPQAICVVNSGFEIRHNLASMACNGENFGISYHSNSQILNMVMNCWSFIHREKLPVLWKEWVVQREERRAMCKGRNGLGGGSAARHTVYPKSPVIQDLGLEHRV